MHTKLAYLLHHYSRSYSHLIIHHLTNDVGAASLMNYEKIMFSKWPAELYLYPNKGLTCIVSHFTQLPISSCNA